DHWDIAAEFPDKLPACTARRRQHIGIRDDSDSIEAALAFTDRFEDGYALRANGQTIRRILDIATAEDAPGRRAKRGANAEIGVVRMRVLAGLFRYRDEMVVFGHGPRFSRKRRGFDSERKDEKSSGVCVNNSDSSNPLAPEKFRCVAHGEV